MRQRLLRQHLRSIVLGVSATPLLLQGCGRSELPLELDPGVIPSRDGSVTFDAGADAGRDASVEFDGGLDGGWRLVPSCGSYAWLPDGGFINQLADAGLFIDADGGACPRECAAVFDLVGCTIFPEMNELVCWDRYCAVGRLAEDVVMRSGGRGLASHFGAMASLEAAAVFAFEDLARELNAHRLPTPLVRQARRAADEERVHAQLVGTFAQRLGVGFETARDREPEPRSLEALALDNAVEGCARETLGAMVGLFQSAHAPDPAIRALLGRISEDELGHAAWSWALAAELERRLTPAAGRRVTEARDEALGTLAHALASANSAAERAALGLPDEERLDAMCAAVRALGARA